MAICYSSNRTLAQWKSGMSCESPEGTLASLEGGGKAFSNERLQAESEDVGCGESPRWRSRGPVGAERRSDVPSFTDCHSSRQQKPGS